MSADLNDWQEPSRIAFQHGTIVVDPLKDRRRYRKVNAKRAIAAPRKNVMDEVAMNAPVTVLKRMNIDKPEGKHCGGDHGVQPFLGAPVKRDHSLHKGRKVLRARADMVGDRGVCVAVVFADEAAFSAQAQAHEPLVADDDALEPQEFVERERRASGLADRPAPALNATLRRSFAFDDIAGL